MQRSTSLIARSARFGAAVAISTCAVAIIGAGLTYTNASRGDANVEMTAVIAGVERVEATPTASMSLDEAIALHGGSSDAPIEERPVAESTVVPAPTPTLIVAAAHIVAPAVATPAATQPAAVAEPRVVASRAVTYLSLIHI